MQELIIDLMFHLEHEIGARLNTERFVRFLEKEKEQIMNAYADGAKGGANGTKGQHDFGWVSIQMKEKYYKQKYNQKK